MPTIPRDNNSMVILAAVSNVDGTTIVPLYADPTTHRLLVSTASGLTIGTTTITGGTTTRILYDNAGVVGEYTITGTGTVVAMATSPVFTTPNIGAATATSVNGLIITATLGTLTIPNNASAVLAMSGNFSLTLTATNTTNATFPSGTVTLVATTVTTLSSLVSIGTITTGVWNGTVVAPAYGGTGVANNAASTITISGSFALTLTLSATTSVTLPTSGTLATLAGSETFTTKTLTTPKIATIWDTNGVTWITSVATASAVNWIQITNAATGTAGPQIAPAGETNIDLKITAKGTGLIHHQHGTYQDIQTYSPAGAGTATLDLSLGNVHHITMPAGNITIALSNGVAGQCFVIRILQDSGGSRTVTWFTTIKWAGGVAPTLTTTASKADTFGFEITGSNTYDGFIVGQNL